MKPGLKKGQLIKWNDERGFGFIKPREVGKEVFLHISAVKTTSRRPKIGDIIFYELASGADGKIRASGASIQGVIYQSPTTQKVKNSPAKKKKRVLFNTVTSIGILVAIMLLQRLFDFRRSPSPVVSITKPGCVIKGNISIETGRKLYHVPGMEDYEGTLIHPEKGERWFCSESEAVAAGWSRAPK